MKKEIIRNKYVSFSSSNYYSLEKNVVRNDPLTFRTKLLKDVCKEVENYEELEAFFVSAKEKGADNEMFLFVDRINKNYSVKINDKITIYHFTKRKTFSFFEWQYPTSAAFVGYKNKYSEKEIISDFLHTSYLYFYFKYVLNESKSFDFEDCVKKKNKFTYIASDDLNIVFDNVGHVFFENEMGEKKYICDSWCSTNEEVIVDLISMSMIDFGNYYKAFWAT